MFYFGVVLSARSTEFSIDTRLLLQNWVILFVFPFLRSLVSTWDCNHVVFEDLVDICFP